jgi:hypothetical protein
MNVDPKEFYKRAAEERAEEERQEEFREAVARVERTKYGYPRPPNYSTGFAKKLGKHR